MDQMVKAVTSSVGYGGVFFQQVIIFIVLFFLYNVELVHFIS